MTTDTTVSPKVLSSNATNGGQWELQIFIEKSSPDTPWGWQGLMEGLHESLADAKAHLAKILADGTLKAEFDYRAYEKLSQGEKK